MIIISSEKFIILTMLEQGKISYDEAVRLLEALGPSHEIDDKSHNNNTVSKGIENVIDELNTKVASISKSLSEKFDLLGKDINQKDIVNMDNISDKLKTLENDYKEKLENILSSISNNKDGLSNGLFDKTKELQKSEGSGKFNNSMDSLQKYLGNIPVNIPELGTKMTDILNRLNIKSESANTICTSYKRSLVKDTSINLNFENINGNILIEGYDGDDIDIRVYTRSTKKGIREIFALLNDKDTYGIKASPVTDVNISIEASIPRNKISDIQISSSNGRINVSDINCSGVNITSHDSRLVLSGICSKSFKVGAENSKIELSDMTSDVLTIMSIDTPVIIYNFNCVNLAVNTSNGRIFIELSEDCKGSVIIDVSTRNARIDIDLTQCLGMSVCIDANNTQGSIDINIPCIIYKRNENLEQERTHILCETDGYSDSENKIMIRAVTTKELISIK